MPWRVEQQQIIETKLKSGGLTVGFYNSDGNVISNAAKKVAEISVNV